VRDPVGEFKNYNRRQALRNPELMRYKIARMAEGPFPFFRGTFHLFAKDVIALMADASPLLMGSSAELDLVGDIHSENYGTIEAEHRQIHYDINDFDETTRGRFGLDVSRLAISHFLAVQERHGETLERAVLLTLSGLRAYVETVRRLLKKGKDTNLDVSETQASGVPVVDDFVRAMAAVKRPTFINRISTYEKGRRHLIRTADHFNLPDERRDQALRLLADYHQRCTHHDDRDGFYDVEDVCGRVSGIGSMGRLRYIVLVKGKGTADGRNVLLEFKESLPSAYDTARGRETTAEALLKRAKRVIAVQNQSQAANDPYSGWAIDGGESFQVRQRGPHDDRVKFAKLEPDAVEGVLRVQASILARVHARSTMHAVGPTNPLAELQDTDAFCQRVLGFALDYADLVRRDWQRFVGARPELELVESWAGS
jgi:uncharacterized protein (DUF2252 family)